MIGTTRAELRKLTTTKLLVGHLAGAVVLGAFILVLFVVIAANPEGEATQLPPIGTAGDQRVLLTGSSNALLLAALLGTVAITREHGHGTIVPTLLATPRRLRVVAAKSVVVAAAGGLVGLVGIGVTLLVGAVGLSLVDEAFLLGTGDVARLVGSAVLAGVVGGLVGLGVGEAIRRTGVAVAVVVVVMLVAEPLVVSLVGGLARYLPSGALVILETGDGSVPGAIGALVATAVVPLLVAAVLLVRRDVTE